MADRGLGCYLLADDILSKRFCPAHCGFRRCLRAALGPRQHDAWRLAEHLPEADAAEGASAIRGDRYHYADALGDGTLEANGMKEDHMVVGP